MLGCGGLKGICDTVPAPEKSVSFLVEPWLVAGGSMERTKERCLSGSPEPRCSESETVAPPRAQWSRGVAEEWGDVVEYGCSRK